MFVPAYELVSPVQADYLLVEVLLRARPPVLERRSVIILLEADPSRAD